MANYNRKINFCKFILNRNNQEKRRDTNDQEALSSEKARLVEKALDIAIVIKK